MDLYNIYNSNVDLDDLNRYLSQYHIGLKKYDDERLLFESSLRDTSVPYNNLRAQARGCVIDMIDNKFYAYQRGLIVILMRFHIKI